MWATRAQLACAHPLKGEGVCLYVSMHFICLFVRICWCVCFVFIGMSTCVCVSVWGVCVSVCVCVLLGRSRHISIKDDDNVPLMNENHKYGINEGNQIKSSIRLIIIALIQTHYVCVCVRSRRMVSS